ncbi:NADP-dependent D-sorbitol-6-phosphate dehydrogenase [Senna tora]|uniref:NADP-dependent D-sorbitol-6-phosphate dehydrogenase n=1 Tax=Senna tora TaxID=362788 RepID=A0A834XAX9_9FABA|nr:NADP-dependent D-sorbitol-6-phosphate dehydrogenase [Senna tora]
MHAGVGTNDSALGEDGVLDIDTSISLETTWHAMEELVSLGLVRSIGISNYDILRLLSLCEDQACCESDRNSLILPARVSGQVLSEARNLRHSPHSARRCSGEHRTGLAEKYKKTPAQIALRWGIQRNTVVIPKTSKLTRLKENFEVFDFELSKKDMELIRTMDRNYRTNIQPRFWGIDLYA